MGVAYTKIELELLINSQSIKINDLENSINYLTQEKAITEGRKEKYEIQLKNLIPTKNNKQE